MNLLQHFFRSLIDWAFRRRSPALLIMRYIGFPCLMLAFGASWTFDASFPFQGKNFDVSLDSASRTPMVLIWTSAIFGLGTFVLGIPWEIIRYRAEQRRLDRNKIIVR